MLSIFFSLQNDQMIIVKHQYVAPTYIYPVSQDASFYPSLLPLYSYYLQEGVMYTEKLSEKETKIFYMSGIKQSRY